ncbi:MAG: hypothetical protein AAF573_22260 [Bacteroidota bacterium]
MKNMLLHTSLIEGLLRPESDVEHELIRNAEFRKGLFWGKPRFGHPEGKIIFHIAEVLKNIDQLDIDRSTRQQLRHIAFLHDTFKNQEDQNRPRDWSKHHSIIAKKFAQNYTDDEVTLSIIEHHDEAFYSWRKQFIFDQKEKGEARMHRLLHNVNDHLQTYYLFFKCDTRTGDKNQKPLNWFEKTVEGIDVVDF